MDDEKKKSKKKIAIIGSLAALLIVIAATVTYKIVFVKSESDTIGETYADNRDTIKPIEVVSPTPAEDEPYIKSVEEVLNSKPVVTTVTPAPDPEVSQDVDVQEVVEEDQGATIEKDQDKEDSSDAGKDEDSKPEKKSEKKKVVIDESSTTIKEKNVKDYEGGEKTGSGSTLQDAFPGFDFEAVKPSSGEEVNGDVELSGDAVGTWN